MGCKESTAAADRVSKQRHTCGKDFVQLSGEDAAVLGLLGMGGHGCISVTANAAPKHCAECQEACLRKDFVTALEYQDRLMPLHVALFLEPSPGPVKYAAQRLGLCSDEVRMPILAPGEATRGRVDAALPHAGLLN